MNEDISAKRTAGKNLYRGLSLGVGAGILLGHFVPANPVTEFLAFMLCVLLWGASEGYELVRRQRPG